MVAIALRINDSETTIRVNEVIKMRIAGASVKTVKAIRICSAAVSSPGFSRILKPNSELMVTHHLPLRLELVLLHLPVNSLSACQSFRFVDL